MKSWPLLVAILRCVVLSRVSLRKSVQIDRHAVLLNFDFRQRMDFPDRPPVFSYCVRMLWIEHQPPTEPHCDARSFPSGQFGRSPVWVLLPYARSRLRDDGAVFAFAAIRIKVNVPVNICWLGEVAICGFAAASAFYPNVVKIAHGGDRSPFIWRNHGKLIRRPVRSTVRSTGILQGVDCIPCHEMVRRGYVHAVLPQIGCGVPPSPV